MSNHTADKEENLGGSCHSPRSIHDRIEKTTTERPSVSMTTGAGRDGGELITLTVLGLYARGEIPRADELPNPNDPAISDLSRDQTMVRRRIRTRPVPPDHRRDDDDTKSANSEAEFSFETATFVPEWGLLGSEFEHVDEREHPNRPVLEERAVLFQSVENYETLFSHPKFGRCFDAKVTNDGPDSAKMDAKMDAVLEDPTFGEQIIVRGADSSELSVGDIFEVANDLSPLRVEITSPRHTCCFVDHRHGTQYGMQGIRRHCLTHALGGWFARVLVAGELRDGMRLVRTAHPHPKWTLTYLCTTLYSEGERIEIIKCKPSWERDIEELRQLCSVEQLGIDEWKEEAEWLLEKMEGVDESSTSDSSSESSSEEDSDD